MEIPIPESIKAGEPSLKGTLLVSSCLFDFFCLPAITVLDYHLDPATVISTLAESNITTIESVCACPLHSNLISYQFTMLNLVFF